MTPRRKPSSIDALRRGVGTATAPAHPDNRQHAADLPAPVALPPRPEKPVRITLDLDVATHRMLRDFAADTGANVSAAKVLRALLAELAEGPNLQARVRARIYGR